MYKFGDMIGNLQVLGTFSRNRSRWAQVYCHKYNRYGEKRFSQLKKDKWHDGRYFPIKELEECLTPTEFLSQFWKTPNIRDEYFYVTYKGKLTKYSKLVWYAYYKKWPVKWLDHIDRNRQNDDILNLREVTIRENNFNIPVKSNNTSGVTGVSYDKTKKWWIAKYGKEHLGHFHNKKDAITARRKKENEERSNTYIS